jgi:hypothetical protein
MVIRYRNIVSVSSAPLKAHTPLVVYPYSILTFSITAKGMKMVSRISHESFQARCGVKHEKTLSSLTLDRLEAFYTAVVKNPFCVFAGKRLYHR